MWLGRAAAGSTPVAHQIYQFLKPRHSAKSKKRFLFISRYYLGACRLSRFPRPAVLILNGGEQSQVAGGSERYLTEPSQYVNIPRAASMNYLHIVKVSISVFIMYMEL